MTSSASPRVILDAADIQRAVTRMASELLESEHGAEGLVLLGVQSRGVPLARRLAASIQQSDGIEVPVGELDVTMYRDDLRRHPTRAVRPTRVPVSIDGRTVVLVDDVLYSGRTVLSALDALKDLGRPKAVRLAVLVDRGHRELPVRSDHVGREVPTASDEHVSVELAETDGHDAVTITPRPASTNREASAR